MLGSKETKSNLSFTNAVKAGDSQSLETQRQSDLLFHLSDPEIYPKGHARSPTECSYIEKCDVPQGTLGTEQLWHLMRDEESQISKGNREA